MVLNIWAILLTDFYNWLRYTQTMISINWQPCTGPGQFCPPWYKHELRYNDEILEDIKPNLHAFKTVSLDGILMAKPPNDE